jgi:capsular polysaccharide biosynthesis protein
LELIQFARILLRRWWLIALPVVAAAAVTLPDLINPPPAASGSFSTVITYSAAQSFEAIPRSEGDYQDIWLSSELTVNAFTDWVTGGRFKDEIVSALSANGVSIDAGALRLSADNERSVGQLFLSYPEGETLAAIADAAITVLSTRNQAYFAQLGGQPATVTLLDQTPITAAPPPIVNRFAPFVRVGLGLLAGVGLALLAHYLDPALRRREDVESLGLPVLAAIPRR